MSMHPGVTFPTDSTSSTARQIVAAALAATDGPGSRAAAHDTNWRHGYLEHFVRLVHAGTEAPKHAVSIADAGLRSAHELMRVGDGTIAEAIASSPTVPDFGTTSICGTAAPETELSLPYRGERLTGAALTRQLRDWADRGVITESCADAVTEVQANPEWLRLNGDTVVVLGAGAEMGPYRSLLAWGADIVAVDLPDADVQRRLREFAEAGAARVRFPVRPDAETGTDLGANLLQELPALTQWLDSLDGRFVIGNYCYADGGTHVRLSMAADALGQHIMGQRPGTALAFLATPTDVFAVPNAEVERANQAFGSASRWIRTPLRMVSGGRLLQRNYPPDVDIGICDALVPQQGPNYALAKRIQRWRATVESHAGNRVSMNVAPATRTRSVLKNKALAAAYAGAHRFGVEVFDPATSNVLMAALLVHDLRADRPRHEDPWQEEAHGAAHGGLWTAAYHPRSALGLAAVLGVGSLRG